MKITYIHHSCFLVETQSCYYLFDYEKGCLPAMETEKPMFVLSSHGHHDHYNPEIFAKLEALGMQSVYAILSDDIEGLEPAAILQDDTKILAESIARADEVNAMANVDILQVSPGKEYLLRLGQRLTTYKSTDLGVAFLIEDKDKVIYHAGDLNDWVWEGESRSYNEQMTIDYRKQIDLLSDTLHHREIDAAFVVLDPRQEKDYDRGLCYFLEHVPVKTVYPMHYWGQPEIIETFLEEHPNYKAQIKKTEE